jgi:DNA (cytosine-5)-methyltransferase 1
MKLLDLYCGSGGAGEGYRRAGFDVTGVDLNPMPRNPHTFIQSDALDYLREHGHEYDAIHASPPCQAHSMTKNIWKDNANWQAAHRDWIADTRDLLEATGKPYVIENVPGAPLRNPITLCGHTFGLRVYRHRLFETNWLLLAPAHRKHAGRAAYGRIPKDGEFYTISGHYGDFPGACKAMGIDWMNHKELAQSIPPAYTEYIGEQLARLIQKNT